MNDDFCNVYKYLDDKLKIERSIILKQFLLYKDNKQLLEFFDLDMYDLDKNNENTFSIINDIVNRSLIDENIVLTNEQNEIIDILSSKSLFLSAPTSFGKTFVILEYIMRYREKLNNIIFIVPTIALMNELLKKVYKLFGDKYNICINSSESLEEKNIFIFVPERSDRSFIEKINPIEIDFLIIDEIYKLQGSKKELSTDDRLILMNKIYLDLVKKAKKVALLGPFINNVEFDKTNLDIVKFYSNFSPVYNDIKYINKDEWINYIEYSCSQLIYFHSPESIYKNIKILLNKYQINCYYEQLYRKEIEYLSSYVSSSWYITELLKRGIGVHHGKIPMFLRKFYETEFNAGNLKILLCTNTLMEGINTPTNRMIVVDDPGGAFELYNLIGRVARLNPQKPLIGKVYICNKKLKEKYNDTNSWRKLTIIAEKEIADSEDEMLYFNTLSINKNMNELYNSKKDYLVNYCHVNLDDIKNKNLKFNVLYIFFKNNYIDKLLNVSHFQECVDYSIELLLNISREWKTDRFENLECKYNYLPYKHYITSLLFGKSLNELIRDFNERYNVTNNQENINKFVDRIYNMDKAIKFKMAKIVDYIDVSTIDITKNTYLNHFYAKIKNYNDNAIGMKILDDLGIESKDSKNILNILNYHDNDKISTSKMINDIKKNKNLILNKLISPFSKSNINSLFDEYTKKHKQ